MGEDVWERALDVQRQLAAKSMVRAVGIPDLLIAATAEIHDVIVLHFNADFEHIAAVTGQRMEWAVRRGSIA